MSSNTSTFEELPFENYEWASQQKINNKMFSVERNFQQLLGGALYSVFKEEIDEIRDNYQRQINPFLVSVPGSLELRINIINGLNRIDFCLHLLNTSASPHETNPNRRKYWLEEIHKVVKNPSEKKVSTPFTKVSQLTQKTQKKFEAFL